jgi:hypothetical protein
MNKLNKSELGFGAIEALLILVIIVAIAGVGWYVYNAKKNTTSTYSSAVNTSVTTKQANTTTNTIAKSSSNKLTSSCSSLTDISNIPAGWKTYSNSTYLYSISYPSTWTVTTSGGSIDNLPILDQLLFTPPGNQGPQYSITVTKQSLVSAIANWQKDIDTRNYNGGLSGGPKFSILKNISCNYENNPATEIVSKQDEGSQGVNYDVEIYVSSTGYIYDFSTNFGYATNSLTNSTKPVIGDVLSVAESLRIQ